MNMKLTLTEACLMEASGELGGKAQAHLREHIAKYPAALRECEIARANLALLQPLPKVELSEEQRRIIGNDIKAGVQRKLWVRRHEEQAQKRWKHIYRALAVASAVAAAVVVTGSFYYLDVQNSKQRSAVARAELLRKEQVLDSYLASEEPTAIDRDINEFTQGVEKLSAETVAVITENNSFDPAFLETNITPEDEQEFGPRGM
jgi:hypothetical protein